ncbi:hypothetical protein C8J56DRAFT_1056779 [Mycena floridula]|nr:hypothetical protein C8J56DRAFT_1056779 [Mycena floridula]
MERNMNLEEYGEQIKENPAQILIVLAASGSNRYMTEILSWACVQSDSGSTQNPATLLAGVSRHWQKILLADPAMWARRNRNLHSCPYLSFKRGTAQDSISSSVGK